jgi:AcrR family transcriptional regulator
MTSKTKQRILDHAIALFNESGVSAVTTNHIAKQLDISPGNLYYHYPNKEAIIRAIFYRMVEEMETVWLPSKSNGTVTPLNALRNVTEKSYQLMWDYRFFQREVNALVRSDPELAKYYRKVRKQRWIEMNAFFQSLVESGVLTKAADKETLSRLIKIGWMITDYWLSFLEVEGRTINRKSVQEGVDLIMTLLRPYLSHKVM